MRIHKKMGNGGKTLMSKEEKEILQNKQEQSDSLADSKKIDLYINNEQDQEQGISLMNVFSTLGKRFYLYIFVMVSTLLLGLLVPTLIYTFKDKKEASVAVLGFDYSGADSELAPDGSHLDITYLKSSYIIQNALNNVTLSKPLSYAQVQSNISISRPLTDDTKRQQEIINELKEAKNNDYADLVKNFVLRYRHQYFVTLNNGFTDGRNKIRLSSTDLSHLLSAIMSAYNDYFIETYQDRNLPSNYLAAINEETLDYLEILDNVSSSLSYLKSYCNSRYSLLPTFRTRDGISFADLSNIIGTLQSVDIDYIYSYIYLNNVYKDKLVLQTYYEMQKRDAELSLNETIANIATLQASIDSYPDGQVVVQTTEGGAQVTVPQTNPEKNALMLQLTDMNEQKSSLEERISILNDRITRLDGMPATDEQKAKADEYINTALTDARSIYDLVNKNAAELFESNAYQSRYMHSITTSVSEKLSDSLKLFVVGAAAGIAIGLIAWVADAFVIEFKAVKKADEKKEEK